MHAQHQQPFKTAICTDYEDLLFACQRALEDWCTLREQVATHGFASNATTDELVGLQIAFAHAYSRLESHKEHCELCRFVSRISARNRSGISVAALEKNPVA
jgi:hypothetical protein